MQEFILPATSQPFLNIEKIQGGDITQFRHLYQFYYSGLLNDAYELLTDDTSATDAVQHSFIRCWLRGAELSSLDYVHAYLLVGVQRNCRAFNHRDPLLENHQQNVLYAIVCNTPGMTPEQIDEYQAMPRAEKDAIRNIFGAWYSGRQTLVNIAAEWGLTIAAAQRKLNQAFLLLHYIFNA